MMKTITTDRAPAAVGAYSQGVLTKDTLYVSGQIPFEPVSMTLAGPDIATQTRQALDNILAIVEAAGLKKTDIVRCGIFMTHLADFDVMNQVYADFFGSHRPARAAVEVRGLPKNVQIEIDAIAVKPSP
ncbi:MAG: reactive intermediate/imine deaminase [Acholeplasmatales bacterium]|nr:MAG: reactive intermediate/imine deaminase [Acholeplasmatales bacterium]